MSIIQVYHNEKTSRQQTEGSSQGKNNLASKMLNIVSSSLGQIRPRNAEVPGQCGNSIFFRPMKLITQ